ncbi:MAG TPA: hypothetical protein VN616_10845 [Puia sp.]|nr:hypothetical protein [Puia sp.]
MKMVNYIVMAALAIGFAGCVDIDETIDINPNGSGSLTMDMDLGQALAMMQQYAGKEELAKRGMQDMDTTIWMQDVLEADTSLSPDKKAVLAAGSVHLKLKVDEKLFKVHMLFPFTNQDNLQKLYATIGDGSLAKTPLFNGFGGEGTKSGNLNFGQFNAVYDFSSHDGLISKQVNDAKWKDLLNDPQVAQLRQIAGMDSGIRINYVTTIQLPRPVKKIANPVASLSGDKKTVVMKVNLIDVLDHPDQFGYRIDY